MRMIGSCCAGLALALSGAVALFPAQAQPAGPEPIQVRRTVEADKDVRSGVLPNGMRYFVRHAALPAAGLSLRLGFAVGSIEEHDDERGFAHLVEHLAFRQTKSAPQGGLDAQFARLGVRFGRDQNAHTTPFETAYLLDFTSTDEAGIAQGFDWLRDVADGVIFSDAGIAAERGVVIAEEVAKSDESEQAAEAVAKFQVPELRTTVRNPKGLSRSARVGIKALRAFYDRWYRPEHAVLVVVGDQPVGRLEQMVHESFSSWRGKGPPPQRAALGRVNVDRGVDALTLVTPTLPKAASACRVQGPPPASADEQSRIARDARRSVWHGILNKRLARRTNTPNSGLLGALIVGEDNQEFTSTCLMALPTGDQWQKALAAAQSELLRFAQDGPTDAELEAQLEELRARLRGAISNAAARDATSLADTMLEQALDRRTVMSPREAMHAFNVAVEDLDPAAVKSAFASDWSGAGPFLTLTLPTKADSVVLRQAWLENARGPALPAYADAAAGVWRYEDFGKPASVVSRKEITPPGFTRILLSNGVVLNFKQVTAEPNAIELRARFGAGRRQLTNDDYISAHLASAMLLAGGLGRMSAEEMERALQDVSWRFDFNIRTESFEFTQSSINANLPFMLDVFAAYLSDPGFRSDSDQRIPDAVDMVLRKIMTEPEAAVSETMLATIDPGNPTRMPSREKWAGLNSAEFARILKGPMTSEPIEVTIAGDVDEATAVKLVSKTLGALPVRRPTSIKLADTRFLRFPNRDFPLIRATHDGGTERAAARLVWPLYVATPERRREEYALDVVAAIFNEKLRRRIREQLGKVYDPRVFTQMPDHADQGFMAAQVEAQPGDIDNLLAEARTLATQLAAGGITSEDIEEVRQPMLKSFAAMRQKASWWASAMSGSAREPEITRELMDYEPLMSSLTLEDVKAVAAKWLSGKPIAGIALPRSAPEASIRSGTDSGANAADKGSAKP